MNKGEGVKLFYSAVQIHFRRCLQSSSSLNRLRSEWRKDRKPANTVLSDENVVEERKAYGGGKKIKAVTASNGTYKLESRNIEHEMKISDVLHSDAGTHFKENKIITKGCILAVQNDNNLFPDIGTSVLLTESSTSDLKEQLNKFLDNGELLARVTTRPGQTGKCDGYILEGEELETVLQKIRS